MTKALVRMFVKNHKDTDQPAVRSAYGKMAGCVGIVCNIVLCAAKFIIGTVSGSVSITADAANNLSDASSSVVSLVGFKLAEKPADEDHPYGHARFEYLAGLVVAVMVMVIGIELTKISVQKIITPSPVLFSWLSVAVLVGSIALKLWMAVFNKQIGTTIASGSLLATAADSRNDVLTTGAVLAAALISHFTGLALDGWMSLGVAAFILYSGFGLIKDMVNPLLGTAPDPALVQHIHDTIMSYPGVLGTHDLMVHDYGPGHQFASAHVEMAAEDDVMNSHDVIDTIERHFLHDHRLQVVLHFDPIVTSDEKVGGLRHMVDTLVKGIDPLLSIHDFRVVMGNSHQNLIFDCVVPTDFALTGDEVKKIIKERVYAENPNYFCVITIDRSYVTVQSLQM